MLKTVQGCRRVPTCARALAVFLLVLGAAGSVTAQDGAKPTGKRTAGDKQLEQAREHMENGQDLYEREQFVEAAMEFQRAYEVKPFGAFLYNAGMAYEKDGQWSKAAELFGRYLESDPSVADADGVRLRIRNLRERAGDGASPGSPPAEATAQAVSDSKNRQMKSLISVSTNPVGAKVSLRQGGKRVAAGASPFANSVQPGEYEVVIEHEDYRTVQDHVKIRPGKVYVMIVEMSQGQFLGYLRAVTDVPGAQVFLDDKKEGAAGTTPYQSVIGVGEHTVWVEKPGFEPIKRRIEVGLGEQVELRLELKRVAHGRIRVVTNMQDSTVTVDGKVVGTAPYEGELPAGRHRVEVSADGKKTWSKNVTVKKGQLTPVRVRLATAVNRTSAWVTAGLAVALIGTGAVLGIISNNIKGDLEDERDAGTLASQDDRFLQGQIFAVAADVGLALGVILGAVSTYYFVRDPLPDSEGRVLKPRDWSVSPVLGPEQAGASVNLRF